jgi:hypothetical protein
LLYQNVRNPEKFFRAVAELVQEGEINGSSVNITLRASGNEQMYQKQVHEYGLDEIVKLEPPIGYKAALAEMLRADGLLIFQASSCNHQIPAKVYEYLYAGRPILGITDPQGDTGRLLSGLGIEHVVALEDMASIKSGVLGFVRAIEAGSIRLPDESVVRGLSRRAHAADLARLLDEVAGP